MQLSVEALNKAGGFTGGPVKKSVQWTHNGEKVSATVYGRPMSYHTAVKDIQAVNGGSDVVAQRIAQSICNEEGEPVFRIQDMNNFEEIFKENI